MYSTRAPESAYNDNTLLLYSKHGWEFYATLLDGLHSGLHTLLAYVMGYVMLASITHRLHSHYTAITEFCNDQIRPFEATT